MGHVVHVSTNEVKPQRTQQRGLLHFIKRRRSLLLAEIKLQAQPKLRAQVREIVPVNALSGRIGGRASTRTSRSRSRRTRASIQKVKSRLGGRRLDVSPRRRLRRREGVSEVGEVEGGGVSLQIESGGVVGNGGQLGRSERPEPNPCLLTRQPYLGDVASPAPFTDASKPGGGGVVGGGPLALGQRRRRTSLDGLNMGVRWRVVLGDRHCLLTSKSFEWFRNRWWW